MFLDEVAGSDEEHLRYDAREAEIYVPLKLKPVLLPPQVVDWVPVVFDNLGKLLVILIVLGERPLKEDEDEPDNGYGQWQRHFLLLEERRYLFWLHEQGHEHGHTKEQVEV